MRGLSFSCWPLTVFLKNNNFIYSLAGLGSSLLRGLLSSCGERGLLSRFSAQASHCGVFSCFRAQALTWEGFCSYGSLAPEHWLNNCLTWAQLLYGLRDLCDPGIQLGSPALAGRFFTTESPGKSKQLFIFILFC